ncbi:hypothetical protein [Paraburkholderia fungorum]|uniref:hypothetical protein n=1 Tax=Paraburkholderia fungorum TaxID=134537 RepID=UPI0038B70DA8
MSQQLQNVISRLYKPPIDGTRQVFALSRADAERLPPLSSIAVISITAPERPRAELDASMTVLRLSFADVDFMNPALSRRAREKLGQAFTDEHADAIRSFVAALPAEIASVVVHCEGGYSRSSAVALALHRLYGYSAELKHLSQANQSIVRVMLGTDSSRAPRKVPSER